MLEALVADVGDERLSLGQLVAGLRNRALGFLLFVFALPCCFPTPPGVPTICGVMIVVIALHMVLGRQSLWLPKWVARKTVPMETLRRVVHRIMPTVKRIERVLSPRLVAVTGPLSRVLIGVVILILGFILILPIPFLGNLPPGLAAGVLALGLLERDGLVVIAGLLASLFAVALTSAMAWAAVESLRLLL